MVPFEYEKKEPSEWFRRGASPGRNIGVYLYGVSLKNALVYLAYTRTENVNDVLRINDILKKTAIDPVAAKQHYINA